MSNVALVSRATAPYLKALHDSLAQAMGAGSRLDILWPDDVRQNALKGQCMPAGTNVVIHSVSAPHAPGWLSTLHSLDRQERAMIRLPNGSVWRQLRACRPDLVWIHEYSPFTIEALLFAKWHHLPVVVSTEVGKANAHYFRRVVCGWHWAWGHLVDGVIACCPAARQPLAGGSLPVCEAFHAVDSRVFLPSAVKVANPSPVFVYVGSMIERKGIDLLIAAAARLHGKSDKHFRLRLVGGGDIEGIKKQVQEAGLDSCVEFTGRLEGEALREAVRSADVFVLPTRKDTYAAVVHEAACLGLPLLVSHHAGAAEVMVQPGVTGFSFDPENTDVFASEMEKMLDPSVRATMAAHARERGEELSAHRRATVLWEWMKKEFLMSNNEEASA